jgi:hypothetical protein
VKLRSEAIPEVDGEIAQNLKQSSQFTKYNKREKGPVKWKFSFYVGLVSKIEFR